MLPSLAGAASSVPLRDIRPKAGGQRRGGWGARRHEQNSLTN